MPIEIPLDPEQVSGGPAPEDPFAPFGASLDGVQALIPEAKLVETLLPGQRGVTKTQAYAWLQDFTGRVELRLQGWSDLPEPQRAALALAARDLVHNATASYVEAARFPERALDGYAALLWSRYEAGLLALAAWLNPGDGDGEGGGPGGVALLPAASFPAPSFGPNGPLPLGRRSYV